MLSNVKILHKILLVVAVMAAIMGGIGWYGYSAVDALETAMHEVRETDGEARLGARIRQDTQALSRAEYRIAASPTAEVITAAESVIAGSRKRLEDTLTQMRATADPAQQKLLAAIDAAYQAYIPRFNRTVEIARTSGGGLALPEAQRRIAAAADDGSQAAEALSTVTKTYNTFADDHAAKQAKDVSELTDRINALMILVPAAGMLLGLLIGIGVGHFGISRPVMAVVDCLERLIGRDISVPIFGVGRKDEIGQLAAAAQAFKDSLIHADDLERAAKAAEEHAALEKRAAMNRLAETFEGSVKSVVESVFAAATQLQANAQSMSGTAEQANTQAQAVATAADHASLNVQTVASAAEQLAASIGEIGRQVSDSSRIAGAAVEEAERTNTTVIGLVTAAQKIGEVVELINTIASQTNLLALNATIEAARAGEAGKGFAVVASEVKTLANQTAKATDEISSQIAGMQHAAGGAADAIKGIGGTIVQISQVVSSIASAVEEQSAATQEIARNIQEVAAGTSEVSSHIAGVTEAATHTGSVARDVLGAARTLGQQAGLLDQEVNRFIATVRAA
ncbi:MAG: methyl-accepting chemotaxis protein [Rhodospirillaceae bacterium]